LLIRAIAITLTTSSIVLVTALLSHLPAFVQVRMPVLVSEADHGAPYLLPSSFSLLLASQSTIAQFDQQQARSDLSLPLRTRSRAHARATYPHRLRSSIYILLALYTYALLTLLPTLLPLSFDPPRLLPASSAAGQLAADAGADADAGDQETGTGTGVWWGIACRPRFGWWRYGEAPALAPAPSSPRGGENTAH
jgi:hypothetical protein